MSETKTKTCYVVDEKNHEIYQIKIPMVEVKFGEGKHYEVSNFETPEFICIHGKIYERLSPNTYKPKMCDCYEVKPEEIVLDERKNKSECIFQNLPEPEVNCLKAYSEPFECEK